MGVSKEADQLIGNGQGEGRKGEGKKGERKRSGAQAPRVMLEPRRPAPEWSCSVVVHQLRVAVQCVIGDTPGRVHDFATRAG